MVKDKIYANPREQITAFAFDEHVAGVFEDMIQRSVPGYGMMLEMIGVISEEYAQPGSQCYDLGCSLGASTLAIRHSLPSNDYRIVAVDNSSAMIDHCRTNIESDAGTVPVDVRCEDILDLEIENASLVVMNFTLQFIAPEKRVALLEKIQRGLNPGGVLVLSEKIALPQPKDQETLTDLYHDFKKARGYSDLEIAQKRNALENVLIPDTYATHESRLKEAGFGQITTWFQCFNFTSILAFK